MFSSGEGNNVSSLWGSSAISAPGKEKTTDKTQSKETEGKKVPDISEYDFMDITSDEQKSVSFIEEISDLMKETFDLVLHSLFII